MRILIDGQTLQTEEINRGMESISKMLLTISLKSTLSTIGIFPCPINMFKKSRPVVREKLIILEDVRFVNKGIDCTNENNNTTFTEALLEYINKEILMYIGIPIGYAKCFVPQQNH